MKTQHVVKLTGHVNGRPAKTQQATDVTMVFVGNTDNTPGYFKIHEAKEGSPVLVTPKGEYPLKYNTAGYLEPAVNTPVKIHVCLKKITGKLIYWV